ncbi:MAG: chemotaxis protein CheW [Gemmataceae bacterium]
MGSSRQYCTFTVHDLFCGLDVLEVQEVMREQPMTRVPLAPPAIRGLINLRGQIVVALDLRRRLGLPEGAPDQSRINVVVRTEEGAVSLMADDVDEVIEVSDDAFEHAPTTLSAATRELVSGVCKLEGRLLMILDLDKLLNLPPEADDLASPRSS